MIASGEKREEYRVPSPWIFSRLENKQYEEVRFRNGYAPNSLEVICEYLGYELGFGRKKWGADGLMCVVIKLGRVLQSPNVVREPSRTHDTQQPET